MFYYHGFFLNFQISPHIHKQKWVKDSSVCCMGLAAMNCPRPQPPIKKDKKSQAEANKTTGSPVRQWSGSWLAPCTQRCSPHYLPPASATPHPSAFMPPPPPNVVYTAGMAGTSSCSVSPSASCERPPTARHSGLPAASCGAPTNAQEC